MTSFIYYKYDELNILLDYYHIININEININENKVILSKNALKKLAKAHHIKIDKNKLINKETNITKKDKKKNDKNDKMNHLDDMNYICNIPKGEKKDILNTEMANAYYPKQVESCWQSWWEKKNFFSCDENKLKQSNKENRFIMIIPPPNVTGSLHLGHGLTVAIQDTLTRWHRMKGHATLWIPGTDHAGIATQSVVEKRLLKEKHQTRHDLGRTNFINKVWEWKNEYEIKICNQLRRIGCSVDWNKQYFSMDKNVTKAVKYAFINLFEKNKIYRDTKMINWSCFLKTAVSDIEVDYIDIEKNSIYINVPGHNNTKKYEFGTLTSFKYKVYDETRHTLTYSDFTNQNNQTDEYIVVATTRLETMLGDVAVAVHPQDNRYKHLHNKFLIHPFAYNNNTNKLRLIPVVCDDILVDINFGTGAVKITPAHDLYDYECGKRHQLPIINIFTDDGKILYNENTNDHFKFNGKMRYDARIEIENKLKELDLFVDKIFNKMRLGICSRSGDVIEPMIKKQWFLSCDDMAKEAMDVVKSKELNIIPESYSKNWFYWLNNIRDWCISRQLWWGHQIPAYHVTITDHNLKKNKNDKMAEEKDEIWIAAFDEQDAKRRIQKKFNIKDITKISVKQDEDVLDTWFSAALFPFAVFGWPLDDTKMNYNDLYYPTDLLETGCDILFFWVARMVFMGKELTNKLPFHTIYLHSMVRDKYGRKMSKSLGNVIDPLEIIGGCTLDTLVNKIKNGNLHEKEIKKAVTAQKNDFPDGIPECGADALRFGLLAYTQQSGDINLDINRLVGYRNFCNKLWNVTKFAINNLSTESDSNKPYQKDMESIFFGNHNGKNNINVDELILSPRDFYILTRLNETIKECNESLNQFLFGDYTSALYKFWLNELCDVYLELIKPTLYSKESNEIEKDSTKLVLYTCLDAGLRLLHPVMPFVTEELWQRLPNDRNLIDNDNNSICIAYYPTFLNIPHTDQIYYMNINEKMELIKQIIHAGRSLRAEYNLLNHVKPIFYILCDTQSNYNNFNLMNAINDQKDDILTLIKAGDIIILDILSKNTQIENCAMHSVNEKIQIYVNLKGLVDVTNEIDKLNKKKSKIQPFITTLKNKMAKENYKTKVPEHIQLNEKNKLEAYNKEILNIDMAIEEFKKMM